MTYRVLVTDDEPEKVEDIEKGLREIGYEVLSARNGKQAIEILQKRTYRPYGARFGNA